MEELKRAKRVFINNIDSYSSKNIADYLSTRAEGDSLRDTDNDDETADKTEGSKQNRFQIVGTVKNKSVKKKRHILEEYSALTRDELLLCLMDCDIVVYNISEDDDVIDEATWAISALHSEIEHFTSPKMFILVSTLMTWALTKPIQSNDPEIPVTEEDYKRRKSHPNFREHASAEKHVLKLGKTKKSVLATYVVAAGLQYGMGEGMFHFFFKASWLGELKSIPVLDPATNIIPTIHVCDLAGIVQNVIDHKSKIHYFIAVDDSQESLEDIVKAIADFLGPEEVEKVPKDDPLLTKELTQTELYYLSIDLRIEPFVLKDKLNVHWLYESGIIENMSRIVEEYKQTRQLLPIKICLLGPPAIGKSSVAEQLCKHYKLQHINVIDAVQEKIKQLAEMHQSGEDGEDDEAVLRNQEQLDSLKDSFSNIEGHFDENILTVIRLKLLSKSSRNQGFVLDGFPTTYEQASEFFADLEMDELEVNSRLPLYNKTITPEYVFSLEATDQFLKDKVCKRAEKEAEELHYSKDDFLKHLSKFRELNLGIKTVLRYFDELEIHPEHIEIDNLNDPDNEAVVEKIIQRVGERFNYRPPTMRHQRELWKQDVQNQQRLIQEAAERAVRESEEKARLTVLMEEWARNVIEVKKQERELLEMRSVPLRHYLMKNIIPTLTRGLLECTKTKPDNPADFLAEFLFKNNTDD